MSTKKKYVAAKRFLHIRMPFSQPTAVKVGSSCRKYDYKCFIITDLRIEIDEIC